MCFETVLLLCFLLFNYLVSRLTDPGHTSCRSSQHWFRTASEGLTGGIRLMPGAVCISVTVLQSQVVPMTFQQDLSLCF